MPSLHKGIRFASILVCVAALLPFAAKAAASSSSGIAATKAAYVLQPSDLISVQVFQEDDLKREVRVSQAYTITLPLIGTVDVKGKTLAQAQSAAQELYNTYLVNPQVTMVIEEYSKRTANVIGSVNQPGAVLFPDGLGMTLLDAISRAGGFSRLADLTKVKLTRTDSDGKVETYIINAKDLISGSSSNAWYLLPNDVVYVPESIL